MPDWTPSLAWPGSSSSCTVQGKLPAGSQTNWRSIATDAHLRVKGSEGSIYAFGDASTIEQVCAAFQVACQLGASHTIHALSSKRTSWQHVASFATVLRSLTLGFRPTCDVCIGQGAGACLGAVGAGRHGQERAAHAAGAAQPAAHRQQALQYAPAFMSLHLCRTHGSRQPAADCPEGTSEAPLSRLSS